MTQGFYKTCPTQPPATFDGLYTIDSTTVHMDTGPTAAFYNYTPHFPGNRNLVTIFSAWFGGTVSAAYYSCHNAANFTGAPAGEHVLAGKLVNNHTDNLRVTIPNNTGSQCAEVHTWQDSSYQSWSQHIATNSPAVNPLASRLLSADTNGDGIDELYKIDYSGTASGMIEVHGWDATAQKWISHVATNRPALSTADSEVIAADPNGSGHDSFFLVQYRNTGSGRLEIHQWSANFQQWVSHIATNYGTVDPATSQVVAADTNGDNRDEFDLINYSGSTGRVEVHQWSANFQQWVSHIATISPGAVHIDASGNSIVDIITADTNGDGIDEFYKIDYSGTASRRVEVHGLSPNFQQWVSHIATSQASF